jgi:hypothetical protein
MFLVLQMKNDLKQAKESRTEMEKSRDDLLKSLKNIHHKMMLRKKEGVFFVLILYYFKFNFLK